MLANETQIEAVPPYCVQGSEAPVFRGEAGTGLDLVCAPDCGQILIENYDPDTFVSIGIKCFKCGEITRTPELTAGEVFAASLLSLGTKGAFLLNGTVDVKPGVILTTDNAIQREIEATAPRQQGLPVDLSPQGLEALAALYNEVTGTNCNEQKKTVQRKGESAINVFPFAWAVDHIEGCLVRNSLDTRRADTCTAILWLQQFCHVVGIWQHHPRFRLVAAGLGKPHSFLHTSAQLITAAYLYHAGNRVGLSLENRENEPNPDLYIRGVAGRKFFLEVKAPDGLQWGGNGPISDANIEAIIKRSIKKSYAQINRTHPGILILSSSYISPKFSIIMERSIQKALKSAGRNHKSLAAVVGLSPSEAVFNDRVAGGMKLNCSFQFSVTKNAHYDSENPVRTKD